MSTAGTREDKHMKKGQCECGATVIGTGTIVTTDGIEIAQCAVCHVHVVVK